MGRHFKDCLADSSSGTGRGKRNAAAWDEFGALSLRVDACQHIHSNRFLKDPLPLGAIGYFVLLQQLFRGKQTLIIPSRNLFLLPSFFWYHGQLWVKHVKYLQLKSDLLVLNNFIWAV